MKQHIWIVSFLLVFLNVLFFTSCEKDNEDLILGRWIFESARYTLTEYEELVLSHTMGQGSDRVFEQKLSFLKKD